MRYSILVSKYGEPFAPALFSAQGYTLPGVHRTRSMRDWLTHQVKHTRERSAGTHANIQLRATFHVKPHSTEHDLRKSDEGMS